MFVAESCQLFLAHAIKVSAIDCDFTTIGIVERTHYLQQGGLASTARTHDAHHLTTFDVEVDAFQHLQLTKALGYIS